MQRKSVTTKLKNKRAHSDKVSGTSHLLGG